MVYIQYFFQSDMGDLNISDNRNFPLMDSGTAAFRYQSTK